MYVLEPVFFCDPYFPLFPVYADSNTHVSSRISSPLIVCTNNRASPIFFPAHTCDANDDLAEPISFEIYWGYERLFPDQFGVDTTPVNPLNTAFLQAK